MRCRGKYQQSFELADVARKFLGCCSYYISHCVTAIHTEANAPFVLLFLYELHLAMPTMQPPGGSGGCQECPQRMCSTRLVCNEMISNHLNVIQHYLP